MTSIDQSAAASFQLPATLSPRGFGINEPSLKGKGNPADVREAFTQFVGEAFFGQMIKAMRSTVGKPAYFHGGRGEEMFQSQLDQTMSQELAEKSASRFADPMFERQFPKLAEASPAAGLKQLENLRRF